jgi:alkanesulfonate monooxygenase SsuD/methylene tetrahydromethanopterin reductase-like flavin-dependent oxidoreductase (luciferase family)
MRKDGRVVRIGIFLVPSAENPGELIRAVEEAERAGLELVGIQDHPYQRRFFDTWTLLSYLAARTERVTLVPDVVNLPLRPPAVLAKAAASLDILSGGRVELGVGAGSFWDAVHAMGGPKRSPGESVEALEEAIAIMRSFWDGEVLRHDGEHYRVHGARPGPPPAHRIGLWVGAYGPRMMRLTGRLGDGWLPSLGGKYLDPDEVAPRVRILEEAARKAGRDPGEIRRVANVGLDAPEGIRDPEPIVRAAELGFDTALVSVPTEGAADYVRRLGEEIAPRARELAGEVG